MTKLEYIFIQLQLRSFQGIYPERDFHSEESLKHQVMKHKSSHHLLALHRLLQKISSDENTSSNYSQQEELQNQFSTQLMSASLSNWETGQLTLFLLNQGISSYKHWSLPRRGSQREESRYRDIFCIFYSTIFSNSNFTKKGKIFHESFSY